MLTVVKISLLVLLLSPCVFSQLCENLPFGRDLDNNITVAGTDSRSLVLNPKIPLGCSGGPEVGRLWVHVNGRATLNPTSDQNPLIRFDVFNIDINEVDIRNVYYRYTDLTDGSDSKNCIVSYYRQFFPRENLVAAFNPNKVLVVTWNLTQNTMTSTDTGTFNTNIFQMVFAHQGNRSIILYFYKQIEWSRQTAGVSLQTCGVSSWVPPGTSPHGVTAVGSSNVGSLRSGEWLFYLDGEGSLTPAVICKANCSLTNGFCTTANTCTCKSGWEGDLCTRPICSRGCVNGTCTAPDNCECNTGWLGDSCNTAQCYYDCVNGGCNIPNICACRAGWNGTNCTNAICTQDCGCFGFCTRPNHCSCIKGYGGSTCTPVCNHCNGGGCLNGGNCTAPNTCACPPEWTGECCNTTVVSSTSSTFTSTTVEASPSVTSTIGTTTPTEDTSSSLSGSAIGAIAGGLAALAVIVIIIIVIIVVAIISC